MNKILIRNNNGFPFEWADLESYSNSHAFRKEIYLKTQFDVKNNLILLFYLLFGKRINKLVIYDKLWWDFCIDTWDIIHNTYNYDIENKLPETRTYLKMLQEANIPRSYSGCCTCNDWDFYLKLVIDCVLKQIALYSPLFCDIDYNYFFYFHETGSIGLYYHEKNAFIIKVLDQAYSKYIVNG